MKEKKIIQLTKENMAELDINNFYVLKNDISIGEADELIKKGLLFVDEKVYSLGGE